GAADGYARMADNPAVVLLHLGPGLANGIANLHNARKAHSSVVNIVGDHATFHLKHDAPLTSDIISLSKPVSTWVHKAETSAQVGAVTSKAIAAAKKPPGGVATLILPADCAWNENGQPGNIPTIDRKRSLDWQNIKRIVQVLRSNEPVIFYITGPALMSRGLNLLARIQKISNARIFSQTFNSRAQRGAGRFRVDRLPYAMPLARKVLSDCAHLILVGTKPPVSFFGYPQSNSLLAPSTCQIHTLATLEQDIIEALEYLTEELNAPQKVGALPDLVRPCMPQGNFTSEKIWACLAALMPENSIVVHEAITSSFGEEKWMPNAPSHDWLDLTGGAIGSGLPLATGAALACPDRKVFTMQADGSAMYTLQALWTQAREHLDVVTIIFANRTYAILQNEFKRVGADSIGPNAMSVLNIGNPDLDWVNLAQAMGVMAGRAETCEDFAKQLKIAVANSGPYLIEARL
ncbi:MAG: acetolactate synthase large subunit, partial [Desulfobacteraceae bacterium]